MYQFFEVTEKKRRFSILAVSTLLFLFIPVRNTLSPSDYRKLHFDAVVADTHNDVVQRIIGGEDIGVRTTNGHSDLPRFLEGGVDVQVFSIWVPPEKRQKPYFDQANEQIDSIESLVRRHPQTFGLARNIREVDSLLAKRKFVAMLGMEGGHPLMENIRNLDHFHRRGVRYITLTWNNSTSWASSAYDETVRPEKLKQKGLTDQGERIVRRMEELGILVDVSHLGEATFWDVVRITKKPVIASHSSIWSLCPHRRNLKDDQLKAIAKTGGVVFINFLPNFIDSTFSAKESRLRANNKPRIDSLRATWKGDALALENALSEMLKDDYAKIRPPLRTLIDHLDYAINLIGVDHVGLGSDFDGIHVTPLDMDDVTYLPNITREFLERGYSEEEVKKVLGENFLRLVREVCR
jgi:membrane dipeptidase